MTINIKGIPVKILSLVVLTTLINSAHAGTIDLSKLGPYKENYKLIGACNSVVENDSKKVLAILNDQARGELLFGSNGYGWYSLGEKERTNNKHKFLAKHKDGGYLQYEKKSLSIDKKTGLGEFLYERKIIDLHSGRKKIDINLEDCTFNQ